MVACAAGLQDRVRQAIVLSAEAATGGSPRRGARLRYRPGCAAWSRTDTLDKCSMLEQPPIAGRRQAASSSRPGFPAASLLVRHHGPRRWWRRRIPSTGVDAMFTFRGVYVHMPYVMCLYVVRPPRGWFADAMGAERLGCLGCAYLVAGIKDGEDW